MGTVSVAEMIASIAVLVVFATALVKYPGKFVELVDRMVEGFLSSLLVMRADVEGLRERFRARSRLQARQPFPRGFEVDLFSILRRMIKPFNRGLSRPLGHRLLAFAEFFYSRKQYEEVLEPTIKDMRDEYNEALAAGRRMKARWVRIRGTWSFFKAAGLTKVWGAVKSIRKIVTK